MPQKQNPAGTADRVCAEKMTEGESVTGVPSRTCSLIEATPLAMHKFILWAPLLYTSISPVYPTTHLASTLWPWSRRSFALTPWIFCLRQLWPLPSFSMCAHHPSTTGDELSFSSWPFRLLFGENRACSMEWLFHKA